MCRSSLASTKHFGLCGTDTNASSTVLTATDITGYGSTLYIGIAMVFEFSPYIRKFTSCFQFQVNLTINDFTAQNMSKSNLCTKNFIKLPRFGQVITKVNI